MNPGQLSRIPLSPDVVDCIVFWSKDPQNLMPHLKAISKMGYNFYFQFTLTPYDRTLEPYLREKSAIEDTFIALSKQIGKERVLWRYDPIVLNDTLTVDYHKAQFTRLCEKLATYTEIVTISFVDLYTKLKTPLVRAVTAEEMAELAEYIGKTARAHRLVPKACCEAGLEQYGIERASCIDKAVLEKVCGCALSLASDKNQRLGCGCMESVDIGAYNTCMNGCVYCYANDKAATVERRALSHDPTGELLIGTVGEGETILERKGKSHKQGQMGLF